MNEYIISAAPLISLSAVYSYDENIDLQPTLIRWRDGYKMFSHPLFKNSKDVALNKQSILYLTSAGSFFEFFKETARDDADLGSYLTLEMDGKYVTVNPDDQNLYLSATYLRQENMFRLIANTDGTYSLINGDSLYVTVQETLPFNLYASAQLNEEESDLQKFIFTTHDNEYLYITTKFASVTEGIYEPTYIERFVSYNKTSYIVRAIGMAPDDDYGYENEYIFKATGFDASFNVKGLVIDQAWVQYYNQLSDTENNDNVELNTTKCITGIKSNRLVDLPYYSKIVVTPAQTTMEINFANLKNIETPEYEYNIKSTEQPGVN